MEEAIELTNEYAPEHLIVETADYMQVAERVVNAGSVFLGSLSPESAGDYASGTNHTLPTNGYAKAYSGVSLDSFIRKITFQTHKQVGQATRSYGFHKVLFHYGSGSIKRTGLYDQIVASLNEAESVRRAGRGRGKPENLPRPEGGPAVHRRAGRDDPRGRRRLGSDSSKSAAAGAANHCDPWLFSDRREKVPEKSLPVGAVLTISAAGSEMSNSCVMTNEDGWLKRGFNTDLNRPLFAIMNPELTRTGFPTTASAAVHDRDHDAHAGTVLLLQHRQRPDRPDCRGALKIGHRGGQSSH